MHLKKEQAEAQGLFLPTLYLPKTVLITDNPHLIPSHRNDVLFFVASEGPSRTFDKLERKTVNDDYIRKLLRKIGGVELLV